ncbi:MAG: Gx transporter family protein [Ruminococcus sp.]|nr:Gx transporter family protein [Ruminococcus sp.]MBQ3855423.1 Gx transporter family protein [Ruminococcus sp.]HBB20076.1 heptaprenyl diphosphate synthase [Ruminococcus sp.]HOO05012.1 Gx transporter family protein [Ruminococcus sp.]
MKTKRLTELSLLTAAALIAFIIEMRLPDIRIPGVKLGLANIFTVYAVYRFSGKEVFLLLVTRIVLGSLFSSNFSAIIYSLAGGMLCLCGMLLLRKIISESYLWLCSIFGAILHNTGQIGAAVLMTGTPAVLAYYPYLLVSGCIAGLFTGLCAQFVVKRLLNFRKGKTE